MKIIEKIREKQLDLHCVRQPVIAFLGDSVTQGCFEVYVKNKTLKTAINMQKGYHEKVKRILNTLYPEVPINIVNAGISGDRAEGGLKRLERDVLSYNPDLVVVCYGLNDANGEEEGLEVYRNSLKDIFEKSKEHGADIIFLTPNLRTEKCNQPTGEQLIDNAWEANARNEKAGWLRIYLDAAKALCKDMSVPVCDCNMLWQILKDNGVEINTLLSNKINHPTEELHWMFAYELVKMMFLN